MNEVLQREKEMARDLLRERNLKLLDDSMQTVVLSSFLMLFGG